MPSRSRLAEGAPATQSGLGNEPSFARDVAQGLSSQHKTLPCRYFYDARGSELFEEITRLPEYYPTLVETGILRACAADFGRKLSGGPSVLIEFGSGSSVKTELLLEILPGIVRYIPIDVSASALDAAAARLASRFPRLEVRPVIGDFTRPIAMPAETGGLSKIGFFPGSTIGNFTPDETIGLLTAFRSTLAPAGRLLIGADLKKDLDVLIPAYDDAAGVTAAFNLNLLARINRELGGNFDLTRFRHTVRYDAIRGRIEMHLESLCDHVVTVAGQSYRFKAGETIHTENSYKFTIDELQTLARKAEWKPEHVWTDERGYFSVHDLAVNA